MRPITMDLPEMEAAQAAHDDIGRFVLHEMAGIHPAYSQIARIVES